MALYDEVLRSAVFTEKLSSSCTAELKKKLSDAKDEMWRRKKLYEAARKTSNVPGGPSPEINAFVEYKAARSLVEAFEAVLEDWNSQSV